MRASWITSRSRALFYSHMKGSRWMQPQALSYTYWRKVRTFDKFIVELSCPEISAIALQIRQNAFCGCLPSSTPHWSKRIEIPDDALYQILYVRTRRLIDPAFPASILKMSKTITWTVFPATLCGVIMHPRPCCLQASFNQLRLKTLSTFPFHLMLRPCANPLPAERLMIPFRVMAVNRKTKSNRY